MPIKFFYFFTLLSLCSAKVYGQNEKCIWLSEFNTPYLLDSLSVDTRSIKFPNDGVITYDYNYSQGTILVESTNKDSLLICYQTLPFSFHNTYVRRTLHEYDSNAKFKPTIVRESWVDKREQLFVTDQLYKSGSLSRGISFGNNQDVFVNSNLNLQMEGQLSNDVNISAVITDQNIPFQPDGNTQQLQDFDRVFIKLFNKRFSLSAGDVILKHQGSPLGETYFLQYYKNVQGGELETNYSILNGKARTSVGASIAKGRFASIQIDPLEGVQGPYRVRGPENERFAVIIAGSEKVFVDGRLLTRGYNYDYVVDYNLGEITFTNRVLITRFTRIRVDYEFSDQSYSRSILTAKHEQQWAKTKLFVNAYSEKDNPNRPLSFDLTNEDKENLSKIGDDVGQAVISGIDSVGYSENRVLYKLIDTVDATGTAQSILVFSTNADSAIYQAQFTQMGANRGNYIQLTNTLNGRVFQWVGVDSLGVLQGDFTPEINITPPRKKQMLTVGLVQEISETDQVYAEAAFSDNDLNLYSEIDNEDNGGRAFKMGYVSKQRALGGSEYYLSGKIDYEFTSENFSAIDRFRYIEFDRDWSLSNEDLLSPEKDHILSAQLEIERASSDYFRYSITKRKRGQVVDGYQHGMQFHKSLGDLVIESDFFRMASKRFENNSKWTRWTFDSHYKLNWITPGYRYQMDRNVISAAANDSIVSTAMNFSAHNFYLRSPDSAKTRYSLEYTIREDQLPVEGKLVPESESQTTRLGIGTKIGKSQVLDLFFTYRNLQNLRLTEERPRNEETISTRLDWQGNFLDRHIISELNYQAGNSRELKREFVFIQVPTGEGTHTWRDENQDGVQDLNEFYLAINPDERNYAKIFVPTDEYVLAYANTLNFRLNLEMPRNWSNANGIKKMVSRITSQTSVNINRKLTDESLSARFSPFDRGINDEELISSKERIRSTWFFNRSHSKYGFSYGLLSSKNKQLNVDGFETRIIKESNVSLRFSPQRTILLQVFSKSRNKQAASDFLEARNYRILEKEMTPKLTWQPSNQIRVSGEFSLINRENILVEGEGEMAKVKEFSLEVRHSKVQKSTLNANFTFAKIDYQGEVNTAVGYELLQALQPGNNLLWTVNWQLRLIAGLQLQLSYNGRSASDSKTIHTGRMQVNALF